MAVLFIFMLCGYVFKKFRITPDATSQVLSKLEMYVFLPALCFNTLSGNFRPEVLSSKLALLGTSVCLLAVVLTTSIFLAKLFARDKMQRAIYIYGFTIPNLGYIGYPLVEAVFGPATLADFMIFCLPFTVFIYTVGLWMLNPNHSWSWKSLLNPTLIALLLGVVCGLTGFTLPDFLNKALTSAASCMAPAAMLLTGFVLARAPLKTMFANPKIYLAAFLRLIAFPAVFGGIMLLIGLPSYSVRLAVSMLCLPLGLNNVVFPEAFGVDSTAGAQLCLMSNILGVVTIPLILSFISTLA